MSVARPRCVVMRIIVSSGVRLQLPAEASAGCGCSGER